MIATVILAFAFVFACFAAAGVGSIGRVQTGWLAIALLIGAQLFGGIRALL